MNQKFPEDEEDDSPETNVEVDNHMPTDDELTEYIVGFWEDRLFDMEYEDYDKSADITVTPLKLGDKCPYCGGKLLPIVYGEPDDETFDRHGRGEIVLTQTNAFDAEYGAEFTIKQYHSEKKLTEDGWQHTKVELIPLNKDYEVIALDEEEAYRTIGIFKCVLK